jgi:RIP metalloprotease RseP
VAWVQKTWSLITLTFDMIGKLIGGIVSLDNLSGPISIAKGAGSSADYGLVYFLGFLALISVNLGIINLFPCRCSMVAIWSISSSRRSPASRYRKKFRKLGSG